MRKMRKISEKVSNKIKMRELSYRKYNSRRKWKTIKD